MSLSACPAHMLTPVPLFLSLRTLSLRVAGYQRQVRAHRSPLMCPLIPSRWLVCDPPNSDPPPHSYGGPHAEKPAAGAGAGVGASKKA